MLVSLSACGGEPTASPTPTPTASDTPSASPSATVTPPTSPTATVSFSVYFVRDGLIGAARRSVPATKAVANAAVAALLVGPTAEERAAGLTSAILPGVTLTGVTLRGGTTARVELAGFADDTTVEGARLQLAQIVYAVTQFSTVKGATVSLNGEPMALPGDPASADRALTRADFEDVTPAILVESPTVGDTVSSPVVARGSANTFEATFIAELRDRDDATLVKRVVTATSGSGTRGTFRVSLPFAQAAAQGQLVVYELSAEDGSVINLVRIPLRLAAP